MSGTLTPRVHRRFTGVPFAIQATVHSLLDRIHSRHAAVPISPYHSSSFQPVSPPPQIIGHLTYRGTTYCHFSPRIAAYTLLSFHAFFATRSCIPRWPLKPAPLPCCRHHEQKHHWYQRIQNFQTPPAPIWCSLWIPIQFTTWPSK